MEQVLRCVLALRIAADIELDDDERADVYHVALLAWLGCRADAHEQSARFGDDIALRADRHFEDRSRRALHARPHRPRRGALTPREAARIAAGLRT
jgi:hypothetical protein